MATSPTPPTASRSSWSLTGSTRSSPKPAKSLKTSRENGSVGSAKTLTVSSPRSGSKFGTVSGASAASSATGRKRASVLKLFDELREDGRKEEPDVRVDRPGRPHLDVVDDAPWDVSVAQRKLVTKRNKVHCLSIVTGRRD